MVVNVLTLNVTCIKDIIVDSLPMLFDRQTSTILCFLLLSPPPKWPILCRVGR